MVSTLSSLFSLVQKPKWLRHVWYWLWIWVGDAGVSVGVGGVHCSPRHCRCMIQSSRTSSMMNAYNKPKSEQKSVSMYTHIYTHIYIRACIHTYIYSACVNKGIHNVGVCTFERDSLHVQRWGSQMACSRSQLGPRVNWSQGWPCNWGFGLY